MKLELSRKEFFSDRTIGGLYINGTWFCYTLEDKDRHLEDGGTKVPKETAIPRGHYRVVIDASDRFKRDMPHVLNVPQFTGIRFHIGNVPVDTEGCILLGFGYDPQTKTIIRSKLAFGDFFEKLKSVIDNGEEVWLDVA